MIIEVIKKVDAETALKNMIEEFTIERIRDDVGYYLCHLKAYTDTYNIDLDKDTDEQLKEINMSYEDFAMNLVAHLTEKQLWEVYNLDKMI